jgi:hypothetical protein
MFSCKTLFPKWVGGLRYFSNKGFTLDTFGNQIPFKPIAFLPITNSDSWRQYTATLTTSLNFPNVEDLVLPPRPFHLSRNHFTSAVLTCASATQRPSPLLTTFLSFFCPHTINPSCRNTDSPLPISSSSLSWKLISSPYPLSHKRIKAKPVRFSFSSQTPSQPCA